MSIYLSTEEAAAYLGLKERKLYDMAAAGQVPCSKVTGKWLFPRAALDRWIEAGLSGAWPMPVNPPAIIGGSHDPLLDWAARRSGSGLALLAVGSEAGLDRLARNEVAIAAIHLHAPASEDANLDMVAALPGLNDLVMIHFSRREEGLLLPAGNPRGITRLADAFAPGIRFGQRQAGAGAQLLLSKLAREHGFEPAALPRSLSYETGQDLAFAIRADAVDCGIATRAVAEANGLGFLSLAWENFDLVMRRRTYFEPGQQALWDFLRSRAFRDHAHRLGGLDVSEAGRVRFNR
ncbi:MAG: helix-turn-helix transcriptional regulator [Beijerinckiaceae bacterium]|jgi:putative molybdopterin biosynthesis protein|nr:helix-turn-helix transcriptional regulator [Beijerinckiaceae bacterium]